MENPPKRRFQFALSTLLFVVNGIGLVGLTVVEKINSRRLAAENAGLREQSRRLAAEIAASKDESRYIDRHDVSKVWAREVPMEFTLSWHYHVNIPHAGKYRLGITTENCGSPYGLNTDGARYCDLVVQQPGRFNYYIQVVPEPGGSGKIEIHAPESNATWSGSTTWKEASDPSWSEPLLFAPQISTWGVDTEGISAPDLKKPLILLDVLKFDMKRPRNYDEYSFAIGNWIGPGPGLRVWIEESPGEK